MTDSRLGPLTEALLDHVHPGSMTGLLRLRRDHLAPYVDGHGCAAAILEHLPKSQAERDGEALAA